MTILLTYLLIGIVIASIAVIGDRKFGVKGEYLSFFDTLLILLFWPAIYVLLFTMDDSGVRKFKLDIKKDLDKEFSS